MPQFTNEGAVTTAISENTECKTLNNSFQETEKIIESAQKQEEKIKIAPLDTAMFELYKEPVPIGRKQKVLLRQVFASVGITFEVLRQVSEKRGRSLDELDFQELIDCDYVMNEFWRKNNNIELPNLECAICHGPIYPNEIAIVEDGEIVAGPKAKIPGIGNFIVKMTKINGEYEVHILSGCGLVNCETSHIFQLRVKKFLENGIPDKTVGLFPTLTYIEAIKKAKDLSEKFHAKLFLPQRKENTLQKNKPERKAIVKTLIPVQPSPEKIEEKEQWEDKQKRRKK